VRIPKRGPFPLPTKQQHHSNAPSPPVTLLESPSPHLPTGRRPTPCVSRPPVDSQRAPVDSRARRRHPGVLAHPAEPAHMEAVRETRPWRPAAVCSRFAAVRGPGPCLPTRGVNSKVRHYAGSDSGYTCATSMTSCANYNFPQGMRPRLIRSLSPTFSRHRPPGRR